MRVVGRKQVAELGRALREKGIRFPHGYPPANLDPSSAPFRGVWAELETLALLARVIDPGLLEVSKRDDRMDTDILIHLSPPLRLQVKGPLITNVRADQAIIGLVRWARNDALKRFRAERRTPWKGVFSNIKIHLGEQVEEHSGTSYSVNHPAEVHVAVVQVENQVLASMASKNMDRWIRQAVGQLAGYGDALLVPVLNLSRYPLNQADAYKQVKSIFLRHPRWKTRVAGALLVLQGHGDTDAVSGLHRSSLRLIGVENQLAPEGRRLKPEMFNPVVQDEEVYLENVVVTSVDPPSVLWRIENRLVWVGDTLFGPLPKPLGEPFIAIRYNGTTEVLDDS